MKLPAIMSCLMLGAILCLAPQAQAHHSNSAFYVDQGDHHQGRGQEFRWSNPHVWIILSVDDGKGGKVDWKVEGRPPGILGRARLDAEIAQPGETITVDLSPAKDDTTSGLIARVTKADGTILANAPPPTE